jgi:hypothetical protein
MKNGIFLTKDPPHKTLTDYKGIIDSFPTDLIVF